MAGWPLRRSCAGQHIGQGVVPFVARVLKDMTVGFDPRVLRRPCLRIGHGIIDRELVHDRV